jgi:hypothetical protein
VYYARTWASSSFTSIDFEAIFMTKPLALLFAAATATFALATVPRPAQADTTSTVAIVAAAAAIIGTVLVDSNNQPYYVNNGRHVYVSQNTATYYRAHGNSHSHGHMNQGQQQNGQHYGQQQNGQQYGQQQNGQQYGQQGR